MLRSRIIPFLLIHQGGLVKTINFDNPKYIGDPLNAVRIFNEKQVDELIIADIDASSCNKDPNYDLIATLAEQCRMPLCYCGGVKTVDQIERIIGLGVEKVGLGSASAYNMNLINLAANRVGSQSIVAVMDVKKYGLFGKYSISTHNSRRKTILSPVEMARSVEALGAGEILLSSVDRDGTREGYDYSLIDLVRANTSLPLTVVGGAGSLDDIQKLIQCYGLIGAGAGSLFVLKGKYRAVLIQYPQPMEKENLVRPQ